MYSWIPQCFCIYMYLYNHATYPQKILDGWCWTFCKWPSEHEDEYSVGGGQMGAQDFAISYLVFSHITPPPLFQWEQIGACDHSLEIHIVLYSTNMPKKKWLHLSKIHKKNNIITPAFFWRFVFNLI